jgi:hypothetical protein
MKFSFLHALYLINYFILFIVITIVNDSTIIINTLKYKKLINSLFYKIICNVSFRVHYMKGKYISKELP